MADKVQFSREVSLRGPTPDASAGALVHRWLDPWLVGGAGVAAWVVLSAQQWGGPTFAPLVAGPVFWVLLALSGTHFGASYHLAYGQGREYVMQRWVLLIAVPVVLALVSLGVAVLALAGAQGVVDELVRFLLATVYTLTAWHFVKQVYGVGRVAVSLNGLTLPPKAIPLLRYGLYPLWFLEATRVWTAGRRGASFRGFETSYDLLPGVVLDTFQLVTYAGAIGAVGLFAWLWLHWGRRPPATLWTPYAVGFLFFMFPPSYLGIVLVFGAIHAVQYLACAHRAEIVWGAERGAKPTAWWLSAFGGAFATGMLLVYWLPAVLTDGTETTAVGTAPAALLFVAFNLHHYAVDASIWRFGGEQIRRIVKGPNQVDADSAGGPADPVGAAAAEVVTG